MSLPCGVPIGASAGRARGCRVPCTLPGALGAAPPFPKRPPLVQRRISRRLSLSRPPRREGGGREGETRGRLRPRRFRPALARRPSRPLASSRKRTPRRPELGGVRGGGFAPQRRKGAREARGLTPVALRAAPADRSLPPAPPALPKKGARPPKRHRRLTHRGSAAIPPRLSRRSTERRRLRHRETAATSGRGPVLHVLRVLQVPHVLRAEKDLKDLKDEKDLKDTRGERAAIAPSAPASGERAPCLCGAKAAGGRAKQGGVFAPAAFARR